MVYIINNIKIGSTKRPETRKYDYQTSSPYPYKYLWLFYLKNSDCYTVDDLLKRELKDFNVKDKEDKHVGIEFYQNINFLDVARILNKFNIEYILEKGDKYQEKKKIDTETKNYLDKNMNRFEELISDYNSNYEIEKIEIDSKIQE